MEGFIVILMILVIFLIITLTKKVSKLDSKLDELGIQVKKSRSQILEELLKRTDGKQSEQSVRAEQSFKRSVEEPIIQRPVDVIQKVVKPEPLKVVSHRSSTPVKSIIERRKQVVPSKPKKPSFMERNPDLEKFIGENLLNKVGIVIFVIGMGFLVKLGIDSNVISEGMRVAIGVLVGGGMVGLGHYMRSSFAKFSSILIGGALAVLYFTIGLAFHEYSLIPQTAAFVIMVIITAFGVLLSIAYDRKSLALLAMIGGFCTPFFVSTGSGNFAVLLTYILILDIGMLTLVYFKKWNVINYLTYVFTYLLFIGVYFAKFIGNEDATRGPLFLFLTLYYLVFFLMNVLYNVKNNRKFKFAEVTMLLSNSAINFGLGLSLVHGFKGGLYSGVFTALTAIFNFGFTFVLYRRKDIDSNLLYLLIGLVLTFVSLIAPIQLKGNYITLFWAIEAVLLLWLALKSGIKLMKFASVVITLLMLMSLVMDWQHNYGRFGEYVVLSVFLNKVFITSLVAVASLFMSNILMKEDQLIEFKSMQILWKKSYVKTLFAIFLYIGILLELNYQFIRFDFEDTRRMILLGIYNYSYVMVILVVGRMKPNAQLSKVIHVLSALIIVSFMTFYLHETTVARDISLMNKGTLNTGYYWHYVMLALFVLTLMNLYRDIYKEYNFKSETGNIALWVLAFICVFVTSIEVGHISVIYQFDSEIGSRAAYGVAVRSVYPVVWGISALGLMIVGMKFRLKSLRLASLVLFCVTILKLFLYDLRGNTTGKVVSFIMLGVILLLISFLYQKLKFIIQDDEKQD